MSEVTLGDQVKDKITGFTGIALYKEYQLTGCTLIGVASQELKDGRPQDVYWIVQDRLEVIMPQLFEYKNDDPCSVQLGDKVESLAEGFQGLCTAIGYGLFSATRVTITPTDLNKKSEVRSAWSFDHTQVKVIEEQAFVSEYKKAGGPAEKYSRSVI